MALVDLAAGRQVAGLDGFASPHHLAFAPDGRRLYVSNLAADRVTAVDVPSGIIAGNFRLGSPEVDLGGIGNITVTPDGRRLLVTFGNSDRLAVVDARSGADPVIRIPVGQLPWRAFPTVDGRRVVVPNNGDGTVSVLGRVKQ